MSGSGAGRRVRLSELAGVIRSKNSGPFELTLDVFFRTPEIFRRARALGLVDRELIRRLYRVRDDQVLEIIWFEPAAAVKATIAREVSSGSAGDTDVYGAQQHMPLVDAEVQWDGPAPGGG
ncbi:MAG TPA: DUF4387 domain-containing protein [Planctomycetota bacterium]|nr:DUF4387 domain-containing protein [Planctomycetota bacterium]